MSAARCKILLCKIDATATSDMPEAVIDELEQNTELAEEVIQIQEGYIKRMKIAMSKLTSE